MLAVFQQFIPFAATVVRHPTTGSWALYPLVCLGSTRSRSGLKWNSAWRQQQHWVETQQWELLQCSSKPASEPDRPKSTVTQICSWLCFHDIWPKWLLHFWKFYLIQFSVSTCSFWVVCQCPKENISQQIIHGLFNRFWFFRHVSVWKQTKRRKDAPSPINLSSGTRGQDDAAATLKNKTNKKPQQQQLSDKAVAAGRHMSSIWTLFNLKGAKPWRVLLQAHVLTSHFCPKWILCKCSVG